MTTASKPAPPRPAGPGPKPAGPTRPTPTGPPPRDLADGTGGPWPSAPGPSNPGGPTGPGLAADLDHAELLLRALQLLEADLAGADPGWRMRLAYGLRTARNAVSALMDPVRPFLDSAAAVRGGPVQTTRMVPGERLTPGYVAAVAAAGTESAGVVASAGAISGRPQPDRAGGPPAPGADTFSLPERVPWPGRPFPVYEVPAP